MNADGYSDGSDDNNRDNDNDNNDVSKIYCIPLLRLGILNTWFQMIHLMTISNFDINREMFNVSFVGTNGHQRKIRNTTTINKE